MACQKLKFVECTVFEIIGGGGGRLNPPPHFVEGVGTKYLVQEGSSEKCDNESMLGAYGRNCLGVIP